MSPCCRKLYSSVQKFYFTANFNSFYEKFPILIHFSVVIHDLHAYSFHINTENQEFDIITFFVTKFFKSNFECNFSLF